MRAVNTNLTGVLTRSGKHLQPLQHGTRRVGLARPRGVERLGPQLVDLPGLQPGEQAYLVPSATAQRQRVQPLEQVGVSRRYCVPNVVQHVCVVDVKVEGK